MATLQAVGSAGLTDIVKVRSYLDRLACAAYLLSMTRRPLPRAQRVLGYARVSSATQASEGLSLAAQEEKLRQYCALHDLELVEVIVDGGRSGGSLNRPGLQRALAMLKGGEADGLLVWKLDRLTRSVRDLGALLDLFDDRFTLLSVSDSLDTGSAAGRMVMNLLMSVAQWQREDAGERTASILRGKQERGEKVGGRRPFGYQVHEGRLVEDVREQAAIARARELKASGSSLRDIAGALEADLGRRVSAELVRRILGARTMDAAAKVADRD
jgi:site-specific DNA recombinase